MSPPTASGAAEASLWPGPFVSVGRGIKNLDPRYSIALILFSYLVLGFTVLGFNRAPTQALVTSASAVLFELVLHRLFKKAWIFPLSALITSFSLSILLNYAHDYFLLFVPVYFAIGSKYVFTFGGRHVLNPAQIGVTFSLLSMQELVTAAPAYQWNGIASMSVFIVMLGLIFLIPQVKRGALVLSFLITFTATTALRAVIMRWHLPFETLFLGTLSSPAFFLFTFFMITDPATSPSGKKDQIITGVLLALIDLALHLKQSYFTFFYAAAILGGSRLVWRHGRAAIQAGVVAYVQDRFWRSGYWQRPALLLSLGVAGVGGYTQVLRPTLSLDHLDFRMEALSPEETGIAPALGDVLTRTDPRIHHLSKWILSVGDAVAVGDFDDDGLQDLFFTFPLKADGERDALYRNLGDFRFERVPLPAVERQSREVERYGVPANALFVDYDSDRDQDLLILHASGTPILLRNRLREDGQPTFEDVTAASGLTRYGNPVGLNVLDFDRDGRLDVFVGQVLPEHLPGYDRPTPLNLFALPPAEYDGDERMFQFMHSSWHQANNGGVNDLYLQDSTGHFVRQDPVALGMPETRWSLALGTGDLNQDGYTDLYVANDFGPDDLYLNEGGKRWHNVKGTLFGSVGRDTYKGMNASVADLDRNGWLDVYVSNVHHALQAEGSLLWLFGPGTDNFRPQIEDRATQLGALNEQRFGWGASLSDLDLDGWVDITQANGMVDDTPDRRFDECPDYWYVNEKIARSPPSIHEKANRWGDIRGFCIYGKERNRLYLNRADRQDRRFVDVAVQAGLTELTNSRGVASVDLDNDGRRDLVITHQFAPPTIYKNRAAPDAPPRHFLGLRLVGNGKRCNADAIGSTVRLLGPEPQMREAQAATGFMAQDDGRLHFGLGARTTPVDVEVRWCGQEKQVFRALAINAYHRLEQAAQ